MLRISSLCEDRELSDRQTFIVSRFCSLEVQDEAVSWVDFLGLHGKELFQACLLGFYILPPLHMVCLCTRPIYGQQSVDQTSS